MPEYSFAPVLSGVFLGLAVAAMPGSTVAQTAVAQPAESPESGFEVENAVIDTAVLFAAGAQEATQELRGAFGWATFQEGQVNGIYYRFDPDGYARFAPTERLDENMFEVVCAPRSLACEGRKAQMAIALTPDGRVRINMTDATADDSFFYREGAQETALPPTILEPLDPAMEAMLSAPGELGVRRGDDTLALVPLAGFATTVAYLRWVAAGQDASVLPPDWPYADAAPGAGAAIAVNPAPAPAALGTASADLAGPAAETATQPPSTAEPPAMGAANLAGADLASADLAGPEPASADLAGPGLAGNHSTEIEAMRLELAALRASLALLPQMQTGTGPINPQSAVPAPVASLPEISALEPLPAPSAPTEPVLAAAPLPPVNVAVQRLALPDAPVAGVAPSLTPDQETAEQADARHLVYLMSDLGLDADIALMVLGLRDVARKNAGAGTRAISDDRVASAFQGEASARAIDVIDATLTGRVAPPPPPAAPPAPPLPPPPAEPATATAVHEYQLLADYLRHLREK